MGRTRKASLALVGCLAATAAPAVAASPRTALTRTLSRELAGVGGSPGVEVLDATTGQTLFSRSPRAARLPASVEKIYTTSTALLRFGPRATLTTAILGTGQLDAAGVWHGTLYLRGGGDPTFGSASYDSYAYGTGATMQRLVANLVRQAGITGLAGTIVGDESVFDSLRGTPATGYGLSSYLEGELSGLAYDRGFSDEQGDGFQPHPALFAAQRLRDALRAAHLRLAPGLQVRSGRTPAAAQPLTVVHSPRMSTLIALTNSPSDNYLAEMLLKGLGARFGGAGSTAAGAAVVRRQLAASFGLHPRLVDGSGLSRSDQTSAADVVTALRALASNSAFTASLSVAGVSGTMQSGLAGTAAQGRCRGKTGTLHDVANLVGYCTARDGHQLIFAFLLNDQADPAAGHSAEDRMAVALAKYDG